MGKLSEALEGTERRKAGPPCSVAVVLDEVDDPDDLAALLDALESPTVTVRQIETALDRSGHPMPGTGQVGRHRRGDCRCDGREWDGRTGTRADG